MVCAVLGIAATSLAQPSKPGDDARAQELFQKGRNAIVNNKFADAYEPLTRAWEIKRTYDIAALLGQTELELGKYRDAAEHIAYSLRTFPPTGKEDSRRRIEELLRRAKQHVAILAVAVDKEGAEVVLDGKSVGRSPLAEPVFVDAGPHRLEARLGGHNDARSEVEARAGAEQAIQLSLKEKSAASALPGSGLPETGDGGAVGRTQAPSGPAPNHDRDGGGASVDSPSDARTWALVGAAALTVAGVAVGVGYTLRANGAQDDIDELKPRAKTECATATSASLCKDLASAIDRRDQSRNIALGGFIGAGVFAAATVGVLVLWPKRETSTTWVVAPRIDAGHTGLSFAGRF